MHHELDSRFNDQGKPIMQSIQECNRQEVTSWNLTLSLPKCEEIGCETHQAKISEDVWDIDEIDK